MILVLNNKNNFLYNEFSIYRKSLSEFGSNSNIILCPSSCYLSMCVNDTNYELCAQKVSNKKDNATTGGITAEQLKSLNVKYCIVGHSDFCDDSFAAKNKMLDLIDNDINPILCISDDTKESSLEDKKKVIMEKLKFFLEGLSESDLNKIILVYEPHWAVNQDLDLNFTDIEYLINSIKEKYFNNKILYGGGVNSTNISSLSKINNIDGFLVGRFGNDVNNFKDYI